PLVRGPYMCIQIDNPHCWLLSVLKDSLLLPRNENTGQEFCFVCAAAQHVISFVGYFPSSPSNQISRSRVLYVPKHDCVYYARRHVNLANQRGLPDVGL